MKRAIKFLFGVLVFFTPLIISPLTIDYYHPPKELFSYILVILCLALWLIKGVRDARFEIAPTGFYPLLLLFCAVSAASLIWARSRYLGFRDLSQILVYAAAFFVCVNTVIRPKEAMRLANLAFLAGVISAGYAIFQYFGIDFIRYPGVNFPDWRFRLYSTFGNPDFLANYLILVFPIGISFYLSSGRFFEKFAFLFSLAIVYSAILITFSLGAITGLLVGIVFAVSLFVGEKMRLKNLVSQHRFIASINAEVFILIIMLAVVSLFFPTIVEDAKSSIAWRNGWRNRVMSYKAAYKMVIEHPVLGVGIGNFKLRFPEYRGRLLGRQQVYFEPYLLDKERHRHVHNDLLQVWVEIGVFGFLAFIIMLLVIFKNGVFLYLDLSDYRHKLFTLGLLCGILAFFVHSLTSFPFHIMPNGLTFWIFVGLLYSMAAREEREPIYLNISRLDKRFLETGLLILMLLVCVWPLRFYLSEVFLKRMVDFDKKGLFENAMVEAKTSLYFDPYSNAAVYLGNCAVLIKDYTAASNYYKKALANNDEINYHLALADVYYNDHLPKDCINEYTKALLLNPCSAAVHLKLAKVYLEYNMYDETEMECRFLMMMRKGEDEFQTCK